jgi:uncharacterized protein YjdB
MIRSYRILAVCVLGGLLAGCGGGGGGVAGNATGRATFNIVWPNRSRLIPLAANSIKVDIVRNGSTVGSQTVARPAGGGAASVVFPLLPTGQLTATATAYPNADGTGVAQATATIPLTIQANQNTNFTITMASTISQIVVNPSPASVAVGQTAQLTMTAKDAAGNVVLTTPSKITWSSANNNRVTVDSTGLATGVLPTGVNPGPVTVTVTDTESGKSGTTTVAVTSSTTVSVNPPSATISVGDPFTFTANVANAPDATVTWSVQEAGGGTITQAGVYTAPAVAGTYHVIATSNYDNAVTGSATLTVQSGDANVIIN